MMIKYDDDYHHHHHHRHHYFGVNVTITCLLTLILLPPLQQSHSFFKLLSMLTEMQGGPPGMPSFTNLTLSRIWEVRVVTITYQC